MNSAVLRFSSATFLRIARRVCLVLSVVTLVCPLLLHAEDRHVQRRVPPIYPELAKRMHIGGLVHVSATVAADGSVTDTKATSGNRMLSSAAEDAVRKWKFAPADGTTTEIIDVNFDLGN